MVNPRISFVVTVYDVKAYINNSIDSIISCSSTELELILVDDG